MCVQSLSQVQLSVTPWTVACQALLSIGFLDQNTGMGCHFLLQGIFRTQGSNLHLLLASALIFWYLCKMGLPRWCSNIESACQCRSCKRHGFSHWVGLKRVRQYSATEHTHPYTHVQSRSYYGIWWGFPGGSVIKNPPEMQKTVITEPVGNLHYFLYRRMCLCPTVF